MVRIHPRDVMPSVIERFRIREQVSGACSVAEEEIVLTSWAAESLSAEVGDRIQLTYFLPESKHGAQEEGWDRSLGSVRAAFLRRDSSGVTQM